MWNYRRVNNWSLLHVFGYFVAIKRPKSPWEAGNGGVLLANLCCTADRTLCFVPVLGTPLIWEHHHIFWDGKRHDLNPSTPAGAVGVPNLWLKFQWITGNHALHPLHPWSALLSCSPYLWFLGMCFQNAYTSGLSSQSSVLLASFLCCPISLSKEICRAETSTASRGEKQSHVGVGVAHHPWLRKFK